MKSVLGAGRIKGKHVSLTLAIGISRGRSGVELSEFSEISGGGGSARAGKRVRRLYLAGTYRRRKVRHPQHFFRVC